MNTNQRNIGIFDWCGDVGIQRHPGSSTYDAQDQAYTLRGSGANTWGLEDEFHYCATRFNANSVWTVEGEFVGESVEPHRKWGLMFRLSHDSNACYASAVVHGDGLISLQFRMAQGEKTQEIRANFKYAYVVQLERVNSTVFMRAARKGQSLELVGHIELPMCEEVFAGLFVCSHHPQAIDSVIFQNLRVDVMPAEGIDAYQIPAASRLETFELATGKRRVLYSSRSHFEAPNWSPDGQYLLFNQEGLIYRFPLPNGPPQVVDTGDIRENNNDHGLSFDGQWLAISSTTHQPNRKKGSQIYVLPSSGGKPRKITDEAPSFWHGWSPDGQSLVYCAERNGSYDVWSVGIEGGPETRLTTTQGLDDGPEYSPDGQWIFFNSTRTGYMKIWKMKPDGSQQQQVSHGEGQDWFAHPSPDGLTIVYLTYGNHVRANVHPRNERVIIKRQHLITGEVDVLAYVYGGQGTLNVPSWSPDSRFFAFVSYTYGNH